MKKILTILLMLPILSFAQENKGFTDDLYGSNFEKKNKSANEVILFPINNSGKVVYEGIIESDKTKSQIYDNIKLGLIKLFNNYDNVAQIDDRVNGKIVIKGKVESFFKDKGLTPINKDMLSTFLLQIDIKDNKYRYMLTDIKIEANVKYNNKHISDTKLLFSAEELNDNMNKDRKTKYKKKFYQDIIVPVNNSFNMLAKELSSISTTDLNDDF